MSQKRIQVFEKWERVSVRERDERKKFNFAGALSWRKRLERGG